MCGIAGLVTKHTDADRNTTIVNKMLAEIGYRGPDYRATWANETGAVVLGHNRLSIIDLSKEANQPMVFDNYSIVFNGEIYNYIELKAELVKKGYIFRTASDTEVVIKMYQCYGTECVNQFNGMWSFAIYDNQQQVLFCSRDRFGKKPFNYTFINGDFYFASEIKQFTQVPGWHPVPNTSILVEYLLHGWQHHTEETYFKNVITLKSGHNLIYHFVDGRLDIQPFYNIENVVKDTKKLKFDDAKAELRALLTDSIKLRFRSDVRIGAALSGGIDSSTIVVLCEELLSEEEKKSFLCVSSCYDGEDYKKWDEQFYIDAVVKKTNMASKKIYPVFDAFMDHLEDMIWLQDSPFMSAGMYAQYAVFNEFKEQGIRVVLDGQGVDEAIGGYGDYNIIYLRWLFKHNKVKFISELSSYLNVHTADAQSFFTNYFKKKAANGIFFTECFNLGDNNLEDMVKFKTDYPQTIRQASESQLNHLFLPAYLHHEDRNSMISSVESRAPFIDYRIIEFFINLPDEFKIKNGKRKYIIRETFKKELPQEVYNRHAKLGLPAPLAKWMEDNPERFRTLLADSLQYHNLLDKGRTLAFFDAVVAQKQIAKYFLVVFRFLSVGLWYKKFNVK